MVSTVADTNPGTIFICSISAGGFYLGTFESHRPGFRDSAVCKVAWALACCGKLQGVENVCALVVKGLKSLAL